MAPTACHPLVEMARREGAVSTDEAMALLGVSRATAQVGRVPVLADLFRQWTDPDTLSFERTKTTVKLAGFGVQLLSRSEARRVTTGLERFRHVTVDFAAVELVGQGFCDEIFRVFAAGHPTVVLAPVAMNESVAFMVRRARGG